MIVEHAEPVRRLFVSGDPSWDTLPEVGGPGDVLINRQTGQSWQRSVNGDCVAGVASGHDGADGEQGPPGPQGPIGPQGPSGSVGPQGPKGDTGNAGAAGPQGPQGNPGMEGASGIQGIQGPPGQNGAQGIQGDAGAPGTTDWNGLTNKPATFAPAPHNHDASYVALNDVRLTDARRPAFASGGAQVTQLTNKATGVTINALCGRITTHNAALAAAAEVSFVVTNNQVAATDVPQVAIVSGANVGTTQAWVSAVGAGSFTVSLGNVSTGSLSQAVVLNFIVTKSVIA